MTTAYDVLSPKELEAFGFARIRDTAFDAVRELWARRKSEGMTQRELAARIGRDPAWVSKNLKGPGNWTLRTIGAFIVALNGEAEIKIFGLEEPIAETRNADAYSGYGSEIAHFNTAAAVPIADNSQALFARRFRTVMTASDHPHPTFPTREH